MEKRKHIGGTKNIRSSGHNEYDPYVELQIAIIEQATEDYVMYSVANDEEELERLDKFYRSKYGNIICGGYSKEAHETAKELAHFAKQILISVEDAKRSFVYTTNVLVTDELEKEVVKKNVQVSKTKDKKFYVVKGIKNLMQLLYILKKREAARKQVGVWKK